MLERPLVFNMVVFVFRYMCFTLSSVSSPEDGSLGPAGIPLPIHSLSTPNILPTNSFAALKNTWLHTITPGTTKKKEYPHHAFSSKTACFPVPPGHTRLSGEGNASQTLARLVLMRCSCAGFQRMKGGGVAVTTDGPEKKRRGNGRRAGD